MNKKKKTMKTEEAQPPQPIDEYKDKYLRLLADFDNHKKRSVKEREQFSQFANEKLILELLPVVDSFGRAMQVKDASEEMLKGLALIKKQLEDVLKRHGAEEVEALNKPFDPHFHEAILQQEHDGPEGIVIEEVQKGYTLKGKLIRPSMVIVSKLKGE
ncbi:MAG: nucleotide exchange factor GrpE [bacterium]